MKPALYLLYTLLPFALLAADPVDLNAAYEILSPAPKPTAARAKPTGLDGLIMTGYQGWFRAEGDGSDLGFQHYRKHGKFEPGHCTIDLWPDMSEYEDDERFPTPFRLADGSVATVFSSVHPKTVDRHFRWMKDYEFDGAFVQRFATIAAKPQRSYRQLKADNQKLILCRDAANTHQRAYALMYDLSGLDEDNFEELARDWKNLRRDMQLGTDPNDQAYLQLKGKPLIAIWGVGFSDDRGYSLDFSERFIRLLKHNPDWGGMSIMLGVPYNWREQNQDAMKDPKLHEVLQLADVLSPWSIGRVQRPELDAGQVLAQQTADRFWCEQRDIQYLPVLYPGFSWHNLKGDKLDAISREGGRFLWDQFIATRAAGNRSAYLAMFDEMDEATALFKCTNQPPIGASPFLTYKDLPSDHYLWLSGQGRRLLRGELPSREGSRP